MLYPNAKILVFCKAPQPGKVKTRLAQSIGELAAADVHKYLARHCLQRLNDFAIAPVELWCAPEMSDDFFLECQADYELPLKLQQGTDLGERMFHALDKTLEECSSAIVVGTDCPALTADYLLSALAALGEAEMVIGPAEDGGYVLLGTNRLQPEIFLDMPWGTEHVYAETLARYEGRVNSLSVLWDVDYVQDIVRLRENSQNYQLSEEFSNYLSRVV